MIRSALWIAPKWPLPAIDGSRVATAQTIRSLTQLGIAVDLLAFVEQGESIAIEQACTELGLRSGFAIAHRPRPKATAARLLQLSRSFIRDPRTPITFGVYRAPNCIAAAQDFFSARAGAPWDCIIAETPHALAFAITRGEFDRQQLPDVPLVYRPQNIESNLWQQGAMLASGLSRATLRSQAEKMLRFERSVLAVVNGVAYISDEDQQVGITLAPETPSTVVPVGFAFETTPLRRHFDGEQLLFVGRLDWPPNRGALQWFLSNVWPEVLKRRPTLRLVVAGSGHTEGLGFVTEQLGVDLLGFVPNLAPLYETAALLVVPVQYGSGTRVKILEAARHGLGTISTAAGVAGTRLGAGEFLPADSATEWVEALSSFTTESARQIGHHAFTRAKAEFNLREVGERFAGFLYRLADRPTAA